MGKETKIAWTDHTFNPWWGCVKVSPGCEHCYAETFAKRVGARVWGPSAQRRVFGPSHWAEPLKWNAEASKLGVSRRVFCASMADVCEDRRELDYPRENLMKLIRDTPALTWLLLTKRPENILRLLWPNDMARWPLNVWIGTTIESQVVANIRTHLLLDVPARVRFFSMEPLLEPVVIPRMPEWVIVGGESGPKARPMDLAWARAIAEQCKSERVPFFMKQLGGVRDKRERFDEFPESIKFREYP